MEFEEIYRQHFSHIYRYLLSLTGDRELAQELTGQCFFKALQGISQFRGDCHIRVWLCQIAKNCYYSHKEKAGRFTSLEETQELMDSVPGPEEQALEQDRMRALRRVLHTIPEPYREVFMWRVFAELSFRDLGELFGKSENWACVTYHRAKAMIKNRLEDESHG